MNKTLKRQVFRHTALYAAILMFSHTGGGGGGGAMAQTHQYAIIMNGRNQPEVKQNVPSSIKDKDRRREYTYYTHRTGGGSVSFNNNDTLVSQQSGTAVFGTATYLPPYGKVSGFDADALKERNNAVDWIRTTRIALAGYSYIDVICRSYTGCPKLVYKTRFTFGQQGLKRKAGSKLDIYEDKSRENSPIYKLSDYPWLGVSFNLGSENTVQNSKLFNKLISSFREGNNNQTIVSTTEGNPISLGDRQREHTAVAYYLNAKLHLLDKKGIEDIAQGKIVDLGILKPHVETTGRSLLDFWARWDIKDTGQIPVKLGLPQVKAGRCTNKPNPNNNTKAPSPALTAPALWFGPGQDGKAEMYSASVSTYPDSSSSRIFLQELKTQTEPGKPGRYSLKSLNDGEIKSRQPSFNGRQTIIRLDDGVHLIKLNGSKDEVAAFVNLNGNNTGKNDTFGIVKEANVNLDADEWKKVLLPWTVRGPDNDNKFKSINQKPEKYSQRYRIRDNNGNRDLGDIVNSPIVAVGGYLATAANDGMVHIFKKNGGSDERSYNLKLSYIPGTMPRKDIQSQESTLAKELRAFAEKGYVGDRYGVDGGFVLRQVELSGQKHVFMFGAMGFGGRGAYALDLSKINGNYPAAAPLFDVKNGDKNGKNGKNRVEVELGYTVGTPQIGKIRNGKYAAFLASGYAAKQIASQENKTALYVYDLKDTLGTPIAKIEVKGGKGGLSSPTLVDKDLDGIVDIAYAGDRGGNMYRFDLSNSDPSKWSVSTIFEGGKPITSAPAVSRLADKRVVIFGTGSDLTEDDVLDTKEQYIYGIFDDDKAANNVNASRGVLGSGLLEQHLTQENKTLFLNKRSDGSGSKGWAVKLTGGRRVTVKPTVVLRTAFVTIRSYTGNDKCGAQTAILGINTADGGALTPRSARPIVPEANTAVAQYSGHKKTAGGKSVPIGCMWKNSKTVCPNGYVYDKPVNVRYLDETETDGFSTTADGDAGGSGIDPAGRRPGKNNRCFSKKGVRTLLMNDLDSLDITGPMCGIKRLSWREVFF
ncbi:PilC protein [Neisseria gonorrhoeae]|uniref:PilC family type IV pilus tip adhesin n=1 Tax=Neisseria gonorrhoeae TaxID=485 RepID=UPI0005E3B0D7|nr:PilC family type IV pilus tip adhesin [Neisseria gonorrhoeae]CNO10555.1 PilC protein [Neisseria gonorrhoeae]CNO18324.1 PilC protein [Neisseria gonorrhoeae]CNQ36126.1 PilC protein [Neisseria gonorrhoeae]CNR30257.1 PilC protein [Neisseria gonorrhoeae]CNS48300.1 PilC protein [Neisseria gonorrhoeae]